MTSPDNVPRDIVPRHGITLHALAALDSMVGKGIETSEPGEVLLDVDGNPIGVGPSTVTTALLCSPVIDRAELDRLGGDPSDFPHLTFLNANGQEQ